jgi:hypothetical protein
MSSQVERKNKNDKTISMHLFALNHALQIIHNSKVSSCRIEFDGKCAV